MVAEGNFRCKFRKCSSGNRTIHHVFNLPTSNPDKAVKNFKCASCESIGNFSFVDGDYINAAYIELEDSDTNNILDHLSVYATILTRAKK